MGESICRFVPSKPYKDDLKTIHFVYETEFHTLTQPFLQPFYLIHLVVSGTARMTHGNQTYALKRGDLFWAYPGCPYTIEGDTAFKYMYISFVGSCVPSLLQSLQIPTNAPVLEHMGHLLEFWKISLMHVHNTNAAILSESVLLYTLAAVAEHSSDTPPKSDTETVFELIIDYVDNHYREPDLSLKKMSAIFAYTEKYLSYLFKKHMQLNFSTYVSTLRIQAALECIARGETSVARIALQCGFSDPLYFSKVFKKKVGSTPTAYARQLHT
ncbi:MAG: helix-turn-helix transcriptional regulator [Clostridia bacterium]|nr:helix-turn-helix transcriptional regulator [Clostridia bacterium]